MFSLAASCTSVLLKPEMTILSNLCLDFIEFVGWEARVLEFAGTNEDV